MDIATTLANISIRRECMTCVPRFLKERLRALFLLLFILSGTVLAEGETVLQPDTTPEVPNLQNLATDWWQYFDQATDTERPKRVQALLAQLRQLPYPSADNSKLPDIEQALAKWENTFATTQSTDQPTQLPQQQDTYSIPALLELNYRLQTKNNDLSNRREQANQLDQTLDKLKAGLKALKVDYLQTAEASPDQRYATLLDWIYTQARVAGVTRERILAQKSISSLEEEARLLRNQFQYAQDHLSPEADPDPVNPEKLAAAAAQTSKLRNELEKLELESTRFDTNTEEGNAQSRLNIQKKLLLRVQLANAQLQEINLQTDNWLYAILSPDRTNLDYKDLRDFIRDSRDLTTQFSKETEQWREQTSDERSAANVAMLNAMEQNADKKKLLQLSEQRVNQADDTLDTITKVQRSISDSTLLLDILRSNSLRAQGGARAAVSAVTDTAGDVVEFSLDSLQKPLFEINETPITTLSVIRFLIILLVAWVISRIIRGMLRRIGRAQGNENSGPLFVIRRILHYLIIIIGFMIGLSSIGVDVSKFALIATALSIGIGFGLQNIINNFVSGIILLFEKSLKIGDFVELESGVTGEVREMRVRSTVITTNDNVDIVVPNSEFVSGRVVNWTMSDVSRRTRVPFGVAYGTDKEVVRRAVLDAAQKVPYTLKDPKRKPQVWLTGFGDSALNFELVVWLTPEAVKRPGAVNAHYCWEIETALKLHNIEIPFPQQDLHIRTAPALVSLLGEAAKIPDPAISKAEQRMVDPPK